MIRILFKYVIAFALLIFVGLILFEKVVLPVYVGTDNEHYLPDLRKKYKSTAVEELTRLGFNAEIVTRKYSDQVKPGIIVSMSPRPFTKVKEGRTIKLTVAGDRKEFEVPDFTNTTLRNAEIEIQRLGLVIDTVMYEFNSDYPAGHVTFQNPRSGQIRKSGASITMMVSMGDPPDFYKVPDLYNLSLTRANEKLSKSGLRMGKLEYEYQPNLIPNTVVDQSLTPGMKVSFPAEVDLILSTDSPDLKE